MTTTLSDFNKNSAKWATFLVKVSGGRKYQYEFQDKKSGEWKKGERFECHLVGDKPSDYMIGFVKGTTKWRLLV